LILKQFSSPSHNSPECFPSAIIKIKVGYYYPEGGFLFGGECIGLISCLRELNLESSVVLIRNENFIGLHNERIMIGGP
jgi:hypothetical protein